MSIEYGVGNLIGAVRTARIAPVSREMILNFVAQHSAGPAEVVLRGVQGVAAKPLFPPPIGVKVAFLHPPAPGYLPQPHRQLREPPGAREL